MLDQQISGMLWSCNVKERLADIDDSAGNVSTAATDAQLGSCFPSVAAIDAHADA